MTAVAVQVGNVMTSDTTIWPTVVPTGGFQLARIVDDGSRRMVLYEKDYAEPYSSVFLFFLHEASQLAGGVPDEMIGTVIVAAQGNNEPDNQDFDTGIYLPYEIPTGGPDREDHEDGFVTWSSVPVNPTPYLLTLREHLSRIAYEMTRPVGENFDHAENLGEFSPVSVHMTATHQRKHEALNRNMRRLIGALWGKVDTIEAADETMLTVWQPLVRVYHAQVQKLCAVCKRGWKERLLRRMDEEAWFARFSSHPDQIFFPSQSGNVWSVGDSLGVTEAELKDAIPNFVRAWEYFEDTEGDEADIHEVAVDRGIVALNT